MPDDTRSTVATSPRVARRWFVVAAACVSAFAVVVALLFFAAPPVIKPLLEERLSKALNRNVAIGRLRINPLALSATLDDITIGERGGDGQLLTLGELYLNAEASSLLRWAPVIRELRVTRPALHLTRGADNRYNVSDLLDRPPADPSAPPPRFSVSNIRIVEGRVEFDDRPERQKHEITDIAVGVPFLSSLPVDTEIQVAPTVSALVNGRPISIRGETRPFKDTHETTLHWEGSALPLTRYLEYAPVELPVRVTDGTLDAQIDLRYLARGKEPAELTISGNARLAGLVVQERSGAPLLKIPSAGVVLDRFDAITGRAEVRSVEIDGADLHVRRAASGQLNLATLSGGDAPRRDAAASKPLQFKVARIALAHGTVHVADDAVSPPFAASLSDVTVDVSNLTSDAGRAATFAVAFKTDAGERVAHKGTLGLQPVVADGRLEITGLRLARLLPYYGSALNLAVDDGVLDAAGDVRFAGASSALTVANLAATVRDLILRLPDEKRPLWRVPRLSVAGGAVDVPKHSVSFESVEAHGATADVRRDAHGGFNFARLVKASPGGVKEGASGDEWHASARKVLLDGMSATFVDETVKPPASIALTNVVATAETVSNAPSARSPVSLRATINRRGTLAIAGRLITRPYGGTLRVTAKDIDLAPFQPYVAPFAAIIVTGGTLSARGSVDFAAGSTLKADIKGDAVLSDVATLDVSTQSDLVKWKTLSFGRIDATLDPLMVALGDIAADAPYARVILTETGELNLQHLVSERQAASTQTRAAPAAQPQGAEPGAPWLKIGKASVTNGNLDFTDHFIRPNYSANVTELAGSLSTLTFDQPADVELHGKVQGNAPVEIAGRVNPLAQTLFLDLRADATGIELPPLTPYSAKYVGYGIEKGKLSMKVHYLVDQRKLTAENSVIVDQLTFGPKVESPDATKLPVQLAVSLLKDRDGVIRFDLPVGGSIDDPQFSVGGLVFRALGNLIAKMATAPFAVLGKLGGHGGGDLSYVQFAPGSATLDATGQARVDALGKALLDRPALKVDVAGHADPASDGEALKRAALDRRIRAQKLADQGKPSTAAASLDSVQVAPDEYDALLARVYRADDAAKSRNAQSKVEPTRAEMETALLAQTTLDEAQVRQLAERRAEVVRTRLADGPKVPADRVFVVAPKLDTQPAKDGATGPRVDFALH
jgi:uncharacterized protein involved in outer membrane biogenesis